MDCIDSVVKIINENNFKKIVEIGVFWGSLAVEVLQRCQLEKYYLIDPWVQYSDPPAISSGWSKEKWEDTCERTYSRLFKYNAARIIRLPSVRAGRLFEIGSLDFVYIDAKHTFESCQTDIMTWLPKIRLGGILSGHDLNWKGVGRAVRAVFGEEFESLPGSVWAVRIQ